MRAAATILAALLLAGTAAAPSVPFLEAGGRFGTLEMGEVNDLLRAIDDGIEPDFDEIKRGAGLVAGIGLATGPSTALVFRWERIFDRTEASDPTGSIAYDLGAHAFTVSAELRSSLEGRITAGIGIGGGALLSAGEADLRDFGAVGVSGDTEGTGLIVHGYLFAEFPLGERLFLVPSAGYRLARVNGLEAGGRKIFAPSGEELTADYGGYSIAASLRYYMGE